MAATSLGLSPEMQRYVDEHMVRESSALRALRAEADKLEEREWRIAPDQGQFLAFLVQLIGAKRCLELGVFVGYGTLWMAEALPADGNIVACDIDIGFPSLGQPFWKQAGVAHKIDLQIAPALETVDRLIAEGHSGTFDLCFIDADKENYPNYVVRARKLVRPGGLILVDNVFWGGDVANPGKTDKSTVAIRKTTAMIGADASWLHTTVSIGDGLTIIRQPLV